MGMHFDDFGLNMGMQSDIYIVYLPLRSNIIM
jgi:hypothetical protein